MHLLLYIQVKPAREIRFGNPFSTVDSSKETIFLDADNHSDDMVVNHQIERAADAKRISLILDVLAEEPLGRITRLLEKLFRQKNRSIEVFLLGSHNSTERMLKISKLEPYRVNSHEELLQEVSKLITLQD